MSFVRQKKRGELRSGGENGRSCVVTRSWLDLLWDLYYLVLICYLEIYISLRKARILEKINTKVGDFVVLKLLLCLNE